MVLRATWGFLAVLLLQLAEVRADPSSTSPTPLAVAPRSTTIRPIVEHSQRPTYLDPKLDVGKVDLIKLSDALSLATRLSADGQQLLKKYVQLRVYEQEFQTRIAEYETHADLRGFKEVLSRPEVRAEAIQVFVPTAKADDITAFLRRHKIHRSTFEKFRSWTALRRNLEKAAKTAEDTRLQIGKFHERPDQEIPYFDVSPPNSSEHFEALVRSAIPAVPPAQIPPKELSKKEVESIASDLQYGIDFLSPKDK